MSEQNDDSNSECNELLCAVDKILKETDWDSPDSPIAQARTATVEAARKRLFG